MFKRLITLNEIMHGVVVKGAPLTGLFQKAGVA